MKAWQRFYRDGLTISFTKILMDEAVSGWKFEIHVSLVIYFEDSNWHGDPCGFFSGKHYVNNMSSLLIVFDTIEGFLE